MSSKVKSTKTVHALSSPYPEPSWPTITLSLETALLDTLIPLLSPIGAYRKDNKPVSKKRRNKRTKSKNTQLHGDIQILQDSKNTPTVQTKPEIQDFLTIGFNSTVRHLETLSKTFQSTSPPQREGNGPVLQPVAILICIANLPPIMTNPLPLLVAMASRSGQQSHAIRIIPISNGGASRIAESLLQPRANILGLLPGAPGFEALETLVRENVQPIDIPWIREAASHNYQPLKVHSEEVVVSEAKFRGDKRKRENE